MTSPPWDRCSSSSWRREQDASSDVVQHFDARQLLALETLEGGSTTSGDVTHFVLEPGFGDGRGGIAATHYCCRAFCSRVRHCFGDRASAPIERRCLKHSHRSVPNDRFCR